MTDVQRYDAVVVGSGFGGSITALRLAQAGRSVVVLERGRRYQPGEFPRNIRDTDALFWRHERRAAATGLYDLRFFSGLGVVVASGVGGGSLIYANIHIRPDSLVFDDPRWPASLNRRTLDPYYDKVAAQIAIAPLPESLAVPKRDAFRQAAAALSRDIFDPDQAVTWPGDPTNAGHAGGGGGPAGGMCQMVAECEFGCPHGAKHSMDRTYLAEAERLGVEVRPGVVARVVRPVDGGYAVAYRDTAGVAGSVAGRRVILAAGTLGTNEILLRSRSTAGGLPGLSPALGHGFSANGDFLGSIQGANLALSPAYGPDVTSVMRFFDSAPEFTMAAPTFNSAVMGVLASLGQPTGRWLRLAGPLWRALPWLMPAAFASGLLSRPSPLPARHRGDPEHMTNLFCIGRDSATGRIRPTRRGIDITWAYRKDNAALIERMETAMESVAEVYGGTYAPIASWNMFRRITTVHPLGGCRVADTPAGGVVAPHGEVHGYPGLFVADGSVIPTAIGFHPVMTIAAMAEHTAESIVASFR